MLLPCSSNGRFAPDSEPTLYLTEIARQTDFPRMPAPSADGLAPRKYAVFVSYRHADNQEPGRQWATWLHHSLETYEVPPELVGKPNQRGNPIPASLYPVFRDEEELPADADLSNNIQLALKHSDLLVVLCSPRAVASRFVAEEIRYFKELGRCDRILALMLDGEPNASDDPAKQQAGLVAEQECLPEPLRFGVPGPDGRVDWTLRTEPIAADVRPQGRPRQGFTTSAALREQLRQEGRLTPAEIQKQVSEYESRLHLAKLKVVAGALGVPLGELTRRDKVYQLEKAQKRARDLRRWLAAVTVLTVLAAAGGMLAWFQKQEAQLQRQRVSASFSRSDFLQGTSLLEQGETREGIAHLARAVRTDTNNLSATARLYSAVANRSFCRLVAKLNHERRVSCARFSPDGHRAVTGSDDQSVRLWDSATGRPVGEPMLHEGPVKFVQFSPDGGRLLTATENAVRVWDVTSGKPLIEPIELEGRFNSAEFSSDGRRLLTSTDKEARVWDAATGQPITGPLKGDAWLGNARFSPDGRRVLVSYSDSRVCARVWDADTGKLLCETPNGEDLFGALSEFSPDGQWAATSFGSGHYGKVVIWEAATGKLVSTELMAHQGSVTSLHFSPEGRRLISASMDFSVRVWEVSSGKAVAELVGHASPVMSAKYSADGRWIVTASQDRTARVWDAETGAPIIEPILHEAWVNDAELSSDQRYVLTAADDGTAQIWEIVPARAAVQLLQVEARLRAIQPTPDCQRVVFAAEDQKLQMWDLNQGQPVWSPINLDSPPRILAVSSDGALIFAACENLTARVWDATTGKPVAGPMSQTNKITQAIFSPDGSYVLTAADDNIARVWKTKDASLVSQLIGPENHIIQDVSFSPDSQMVASAYSDGSAELWDAVSGRVSTNRIQHSPMIICIRFSPDGQLVATASGYEAGLWDAATGKALTPPLRSVYPMISVEFSADGQQLLTLSGVPPGVLQGSGDQLKWEARVWETATGKATSAAMRFEAEDAFAHFSPDGQWVLTASESEVRIWETATGKPVTEALPHPRVLRAAQFSADSRVLLTGSSDGTVEAQAIFPAELPEIAVALAEAGEWLAECRMNERGALERLPARTQTEQAEFWKTNRHSAIARTFFEWLISTNSLASPTATGGR